MSLITLLDIVTQTCDELGLARPGTAGVIASTLPQDRQMLALLTGCGRELMSMHQWSGLIATATITTATASASYSLPADFGRVLDDGSWNRTNHFPMLGSISPQRNQFWLSSSVIAPATRKEFRITLSADPNVSATVYVQPVPTAVETLSFFYLSSYWIASSTGTTRGKFVADDDHTRLGVYLLVKMLKWKWREAKGLDASNQYQDFLNFLNMKIANDLGSPTIDMAGPVGPAPYDWVNIPDGNWSIT